MMTLGDLVGFPTVTDGSNLDLIEYARAALEPHATDVSLTYDSTAQKANLLATIGPDVDGGLVLSGHSDVVPAEEADWTASPFLAVRREQKVYGRGTADMKGFLACVMEMAAVYSRADLARPIHISITYDEEVGCRGAPVLLADLEAKGRKPAAAIIGEPTDMAIVTSHKGCYEYTTVITGLEGHGSMPGQAVNAVQYATRYVSHLMELAAELRERVPDGSPYAPPEPTISVGGIAGGAARNIVAGECRIEWEMRPVVRADASFVLDRIASVEEEIMAEMSSVSPDATVETVTEGAVDGLEDSANNPAFEILSEILGDHSRQVASFGTEAGLFQLAGIPAVVCGPGSIDVAHRPDEHIGLDQIERCLDMLGGLIPYLQNT